MRAGSGNELGGIRRTAAVVVCSDEPLYGRGLVRLLEQKGDLGCVYVESLERLARVVRGGDHEIAILVTFMLDAESIRQLRVLRRERPSLGLCVVAEHVERNELLALLQERSDRFALLVRSRRPDIDDVVDALRQVRSGGAAFGPSTLDTLLASRSGADERLAALSELELEILRLVAMGYRNRTIAKRLARSEKAIEKHVGHVFAKLGLGPRTSEYLDRRVVAARIFLSESPSQLGGEEP